MFQRNLWRNLMQKKLFLEKIDGTDRIKTEEIHSSRFEMNRYITYHFTQMFKKSFLGMRNELNDPTQVAVGIDNSLAISYLIEQQVPTQMWQFFLKDILHDGFIRNFTLALISYEKQRGKNYVLSKNLTKYLQKISLDVPVSVLPERFAAYFEPQGLKDETDNTDVICSFITIGDELGANSILMGMVTSGSNPGDLHFRSFNIGHLDEARKKNKTLDDLCREYFGKTAQGDDIAISESPCHRMFINALLYVANPNEDFNIEKNVFDKKRDKRRTQQKIYTKKEYIKIGYENAEHLKLQLEKETEVRWHFRDQPYGPGRTLRKKILIAPHVRKYKKTIKD